jgi:hypothetical protein
MKRDLFHSGKTNGMTQRSGVHLRLSPFSLVGYVHSAFSRV